MAKTAGPAGRSTQGVGIFGGINVGAGDNVLKMMVGSAVIKPANSTVAANAEEERSYTTGLTAFGLKAGDFVYVNPQTVLNSGIGIGHCRVISADTLHVNWLNASGGASAPNDSDDYIILAVRWK